MWGSMAAGWVGVMLMGGTFLCSYRSMALCTNLLIIIIFFYYYKIIVTYQGVSLLSWAMWGRSIIDKTIR